MVPRERVQQRTAEKFGEVPETARQDWRLQRTVKQVFVDRAEADKIALRNWFEEMCGQHGVNEAKIIKIVVQKQGITEVPKTASQDWRLQRTVEQAWSGRTGETRRARSWRVKRRSRTGFSATKWKGDVAGLVSEQACMFLRQFLLCLHTLCLFGMSDVFQMGLGVCE